MKKTLALIFAALLSSHVLAHSRTDMTVPKDGATVEKAPTQIQLKFNKDIRLTKVEAFHPGGMSHVLDTQSLKGFESHFTLPFQAMGNGLYRIEWRGLGTDGHAMQGEFSFTVK